MPVRLVVTLPKDEGIGGWRKPLSGSFIFFVYTGVEKVRPYYNGQCNVMNVGGFNDNPGDIWWGGSYGVPPNISDRYSCPGLSETTAHRMSVN